MYDKIREELNTGDVITFSGKSHVSNGIKRFTDSDISHVGMVLKKGIVEGKKRVFLIESTSLENLPDVFTGQKFQGVQVQYLSDRIKDYDGQVYLRKLKKPLTDGQKAQLIIFLMIQHKAKKEYDTIGAIGAGIDIFDFLLSNVDNYDEFFCSELVAAGFKHIGLLPESYKASEATPADVTDYDFLAERIQIK